jgi:hypothetical protein
MRGQLSITILAVLLGSCSASEGIEPLGDGQYFVTGTGAFGSYEIANQRARDRAQEYCQSQGQTMQEVDLSHDQSPLGVDARLTFECD